MGRRSSRTDQKPGPWNSQIHQARAFWPQNLTQLDINRSPRLRISLCLFHPAVQLNQAQIQPRQTLQGESCGSPKSSVPLISRVQYCGTGDPLD